ncbi:MAG TPA: LysR family transcriptional regulator [Xanthobacteraceae bacterium]|nr:LysR family transcriptional regulator [Xanthobacteraceae bacterium]
MISITPGWDLYRSFLAVLRLGSLSGAARELDLTQPTLGRHIQELEASLGQTLFTRSQAGLMPTRAALQLQPHAEAMASAASALLRAASGALDEPEGSVRVTTSEIMGVEVLPPILTAFREAHPKIIIELALSNLNQDLLRRDADIAVRMARPTQAALLAKRLGAVPVGLFAHRRYLARHGVPASFEDILAHHTLIGFDADAAALRTFRQTGLPIARDMFAFRSDSDHAQLAALRTGFGIAGCQKRIAARDPDLVAVLPQAFRMELEMWLVMHEDLRASRRVRLLYDHLAEALAAHAGEPAIQAPEKPGKIRAAKGRRRG